MSREASAHGGGLLGGTSGAGRITLVVNQVIGFMHGLSNMPDDSIHSEILRDNIAVAQENPACGNWAGGIVKQYRRLGMALPCSSSGIAGLNSLGFHPWRVSSGQVWGGLHVSPRTAPSKRAELCTYFAWFLRPSQFKIMPYFELQCPFAGLSSQSYVVWPLL